MKADVPPLPDRVPAKRRQVEQLLDVHIAMWLASDTITPSQRRRLEDEKARRKALVPDNPVGLLVSREGVSPPQMERIVEILRSAQPTAIVHSGVGQALHAACKRISTVEPTRNLRGWQMTMPAFQAHGADADHMKEVVRRSNLVIAAPKNYTPSPDGGVWDAARYAKHRNIAVNVILPNGEIYNGDGGT